jgi:hypothetical protein
MGIMLLASFGLNGPAVKNTKEKHSSEEKKISRGAESKSTKGIA